MRTKYNWFQDGDLRDTLQALPGIWVFSDGGILGKNNAVSTGIVYAFTLYHDGVEVYRECETCSWRKTSNQAEIYAAWNGVQAAQFRYPTMPINLVLDSGVTFQRIQAIRTLPVDADLKGEAESDKLLYREGFKHSSIASITRVSGHPLVKWTKPVPDSLCEFIPVKDKSTLWHRHNILVDKLCNDLKERLSSPHDVR